jgi:uroporphyrinogen-III synthase
VAVTRDEPDDGALSRALRHQGFVPVWCKVLEEQAPVDPHPLHAAAEALADFDLIVFSSARAARAVTRARSTPWPAGVRTAAVGPRTAEAVVRAGVQTSPLVGDGDGAAALWTVLAGEDWRGRRVLLPAVAEGHPLLATQLRAAGAAVEEVVAYRMVPRPQADILSDWSAAGPDAVVVASPSVAHGLVRALGADGLAALAAIVAIGPTTSAALAAEGVPHHVSPRADFETVAQLLRTLCPAVP